MIFALCVLIVAIAAAGLISLIEAGIIYGIAALLSVGLSFKLIFFIVFVFNLFFGGRHAATKE